MKNTIINLILLITLFFQANITFGQIKGNGKLIIQEVEVTPFEKLHINFPVILTLDANAEYSLTISTDENIFPEIVLKNKNNKLSILQDKWIQPTTMVQVTIGTKGLTTFTTGGYGTANIYNLNQSELIINNEVGKVMLSGKVNTLTFRMGTGDLNAEKLEAQNIKGTITSHGEAFVNATKSIEADISDNGKLVYLKEPENLKINSDEDAEVLSAKEEKLTKKNSDPVQYVKVNLKNNRFTRIQTYVKGPKNRKFSYGMPFNPKQTRVENYPVGTQIFKVGKFGTRKLLITIKAEDEGKIVDLFESN